MPNSYSPRWFATFLPGPLGRDAEGLAREVAFLERALPRPAFSRVLDVCCGPGRHALPLAERGYQVTGVDRDPAAIGAARRAAGRLPFDARLRLVEANVLSPGALAGRYDAAICMWQSFGFADEVTNRELLRRIAAALRPGGRLVLDVYDRRFFEGKDGRREVRVGDTVAIEEKRLEGRRLHVTIDYAGTRERDEFDWELFTPDELGEAGERVGLRRLGAFADFDERRPPSGSAPRVQLLFERVGDVPPPPPAPVAPVAPDPRETRTLVAAPSEPQPAAPPQSGEISSVLRYAWQMGAGSAVVGAVAWLWVTLTGIGAEQIRQVITRAEGGLFAAAFLAALIVFGRLLGAKTDAEVQAETARLPDESEEEHRSRLRRDSARRVGCVVGLPVGFVALFLLALSSC